MKYSPRRILHRHAANLATALAFGAATGAAGAGEMIHLLENVATPQQNVCQGSGCGVNTQTYAWHQTQWRRWPGAAKLLPAPGRGDRIEPVSARPQFDMPTPTTPATSAPAMSGAGRRAPVSAPAAPRRSTPPAGRPSVSRGGNDRGNENQPPLPNGATGVGPSSSESTGPPIDLDELFKDEDDTTTPIPAPTESEPQDIPPPFDAERSGAVKPRDPNRTLNALSAGLRATKPPAARAAAPDPWQAAPVRNVNEERAAGEGPKLNEPNLMPEPTNGPALQATPIGDSAAVPVDSGVQDSEVAQVSHWEAAGESQSVSGPLGRNPLRSSGATPGRKSNPLRR